MAKGMSIHIGLNSVDPNHYNGWDGRLRACEFDANDMRDIARQMGYNKSRVLLTREATTERVINEIQNAANYLDSGDILFLTYSGHGGQVPDRNNDEADAQDETWLLFDRQIVDDELYSLYSNFKPGVRILVLSDSCHSGTVTRVDAYISEIENNSDYRNFFFDSESKNEINESKEDDYFVELNITDFDQFRVMPEDIRNATYFNNQQLYDEIQRENPRGNRASVEASILLISGCQDWQLSGDGVRNGVFTRQLLQVWEGGQFRGNYIKFHEDIYRNMPLQQKPNYYKAGIPSSLFESQQPFTI